MPPSSQATVFAGELRRLQLQQASVTTRYSNWDSGVATPTGCIWMFLKTGSYPSLPAFTGPFHTVSFSSLHLFTSHLLWLEHDPMGTRKSRSDTISNYCLPSRMKHRFE